MGYKYMVESYGHRRVILAISQEAPRKTSKKTDTRGLNQYKDVILPA